MPQRSFLLRGEEPEGHRIKPLITQHKRNKRHINKSKQTQHKRHTTCKKKKKRQQAAM